MLHTILTGQASIGLVVLFVFCLAVAWATGRAAARSWEPALKAAAYLLLLTVAIRFLHMALYHGTMSDPVEYVIDAAIALVVGLAGWRAAVDRRATTGWQERLVGGRPAYVMPNPSGLTAHVRVADLSGHLRSAFAGPAGTE